MRSKRLYSLATVALALTCCTRSPADQLKNELKVVASWAATARMVGEAWQKGNVPHAYAVKTLGNAQETLQDEAKTIRELKPEGGAEIQAAALTQAQGLGELVGEMRAAVEKRDGQVLARLLKQLETEEQAIRATAKSGGVAEP